MNKSQITFSTAVKEEIPLKFGLTGPTGAGKTHTALSFATNLVKPTGGKIALIDTEGRSARKYADIFDFDVFEITGQYDPAIYCQAINTAVQAGYEVLIIDSLSHAWNGAGGVLEIVDRAGAKMGNNKWAGWSKGRPAQNKLVQTLLNARIHIIGTMRSKTDWIIDEKNKPQKVGLASIQSDEFEYEFDLIGMMNMDHSMTITKSRCPLIEVNTEQTDIKHMAQTLHSWLTDGVPLPEPRVMTAGETYLADNAGKSRLNKLFTDLGITNGSSKDFQPYLSKLGLATFSDFIGAEDELHAQIAKIHAQLNPPNKIKTLEDLRKACRAEIAPNISDSEIARLSGVDTLTELAGLDLNLQRDIIVAAFTAEMASMKPAQPKNITDIDDIKDNKDTLPNKGQGDTDTPADDTGTTDSPKS